MITIKNYRGEVRILSDDVYVLTENSGDPGYCAGTVVRLISGVDDCTIPGYHFNKRYKTVCKIGATTAQHVGVLASSLRKLSAQEAARYNY